MNPIAENVGVASERSGELTTASSPTWTASVGKRLEPLNRLQEERSRLVGRSRVLGLQELGQPLEIRHRTRRQPHLIHQEPLLKRAFTAASKTANPSSTE